MNKFEEMNEKGKVGEAVIASYLSALGYKVTDVSGDAAYQKRDIDFIINDEITVEIKTDYQIAATGNFLFEDVFHKDWGDVDGWFHYCDADYLCFYDIVSQKAYWLDVKVMRQVVPKRAEYRTYFTSGESCQKGCYLLDICAAISCRTPARLVVGRSKIGEGNIE